MAAFNTVSVKRLVPCTRCGDEGSIEVQFAYGDTQQLHYGMGDEIRWGGNDVGDRDAEHVFILGTPEYCRRCGVLVPEEYVLHIKQNRLVDYRLATPEDVATLE